MTQRERDAHAWMRNALKGNGDRITRIENLLAEGTPDTNGCVGGMEFWLEIKAPKEPARLNSYLFRNNSNHMFTQGQKNWALAQIKVGGNMWAFLNTDHRKLLIPGVYIEHLNDMTIGEAIAAAVWEHHRGEALELKHKLLRAALSQRMPTRLSSAAWKNMKSSPWNQNVTPHALQDHPV